MSNKWKRERSSFATGKQLTSVAEPAKIVELSPIPEDEKSEVNSMITNLRESISRSLDYFSTIEEANAFAAPVSSISSLPLMTCSRSQSRATQPSSKIQEICTQFVPILRNIAPLISLRMIFN